MTLMCAAMLTFLGCVNAESSFRAGYNFGAIDKIAVVDVIGPVGGEGAKNQIADFFTMELMQKGYTPIERSQVQILLNEQKFQRSNITSDAEMAQAGRILNVPVVLYVNVSEFSEDISMTAKIVDVQDGGIVWTGWTEGSGGKTLGAIGGAVVGAVVGSQVAGGGNKTEGAVIGAVAGGAAGHLLSPKKQEQMRKAIREICANLPPRYPMYQQQR
jgi:uncharacterized membrane protein